MSSPSSVHRSLVTLLEPRLSRVSWRLALVLYVLSFRSRLWIWPLGSGHCDPRDSPYSYLEVMYVPFSVPEVNACYWKISYCNAEGTIWPIMRTAFDSSGQLESLYSRTYLTILKDNKVSKVNFQYAGNAIEYVRQEHSRIRICPHPFVFVYDYIQRCRCCMIQCLPVMVWVDASLFQSELWIWSSGPASFILPGVP